jgi:hypothetical protein
MIVTVIQNVTASLTPSPAPTFYHGEQFEMNTHDEVSQKIVFLEHPIRGKDLTPNVSPAMAHSIEYTINLFFLDKSNLSDTIIQRQPIIDAMLALKRQFIIRLCNNPNVKDVTAVEHLEVYNVLDLNLDGIWATITLTLYDKESVCLT